MDEIIQGTEENPRHDAKNLYDCFGWGESFVEESTTFQKRVLPEFLMGTRGMSELLIELNALPMTTLQKLAIMYSLGRNIEAQRARLEALDKLFGDTHE